MFKRHFVHGDGGGAHTGVVEQDIESAESLLSFREEGFDGGAINGRPVPGALTYCFIEGFILQSMIQGTGLAMLELEQKIHAPVMVGDTIGATVEIIGVKPTSSSGRAVVDSLIEVFNQRGIKVMTYTARRLLAGRNP